MTVANAGPIVELDVIGARGESAADIARRQGTIAPGATDDDFIAWLAGLKSGTTTSLTVTTFGSTFIAANDVDAAVAQITAHGFKITNTLSGVSGVARADAGLEVQHDGSGHAIISIYQTQTGKNAGASGQEESAIVFMGRDAGNTICHMGSISSIWNDATDGTAKMVMRIASTYNSGANEEEDVQIWGGDGINIFGPDASNQIFPGYHKMAVYGDLGIGGNPGSKIDAFGGNFLYVEGPGNLLVLNQPTSGGATHYTALRVTNQNDASASLLIGLEGSTGAEMATGSGAYAAVINTPGNTTLSLATGGVRGISLSPSGLFTIHAANYAAVSSHTIGFGSGNAPAVASADPSLYFKIKADNGNSYVIPMWQAA